MTISPERLAELLQWADSHCTKGAAATRAAATRPEEYGRCVNRLDELWWQWGARIWASWSPADRTRMEQRIVELDEYDGQSGREASRRAFLELLAQKQGAAA